MKYYVNYNAAPGGCGSRELPFSSISQAELALPGPVQEKERRVIIF